MLKVLNWDAHADGSLAGLVKVGGFEFAIHYIAGEIRVYGVGGGAGNWKAKGAAVAAKKWAADAIAALGPDFAAAHKLLYAVPA